MNRYIRVAAWMIVASCTSLATPQLPSQKIISLEIATTIAREAINKCRADGFHVTVTVVDSGNAIRAVMRDDTAALSTLDVSRMKATSVILFGRPSGPPPNLAPGQPVPAPVIPGTIFAIGGVPITVGDQIVGAVAVSGAPGGDKDAACANFGIEKASYLFK